MCRLPRLSYKKKKSGKGVNKNVNVWYFADRDGAAGCGVFCAVYNALQQLQQDEEVDLVTIVRQLQIRRPEMITTLVSTRASVWASRQKSHKFLV